MASPSPSRIPPQSERKITPGSFETPRSLIENASLLTHAELLLALMIHRIPPDGASPVSISDSTWEKWTGLKVRMFELAVAGLRKKGLKIGGSRKQPVYSWDEARWLDHVKTHSREEKARTEGRKQSVAAKPGMQIHPDCALKGCQHLCDTQACEPAKVVPITLGTDPPFAQPVARIETKYKKTKDQRKGETWGLSLGAVQRFFPTSDSQFIEKLLLAVKQRVLKFTDEQLSQAILAAHHKGQRSEGLFLQRVPGALQAIIEGRIGQPEEPRPAFSQAQIEAHIEKHTLALKRAGIADLAQRMRLLETHDLVKLDDALNEIESTAIERLRARAALDVIRAQVEPKLKPYRHKMSAENLETLRERFIGEQLLTDAGLSRMSLYYL